MASALLVSQNDTYWGGERKKVYMRKAPANLDPSVAPSTTIAASPNPNPSRSPASHASSRNHNQIAGVGPSVSESSSSFGRRRPHVSGGHDGKVAFNIAGLSRPEVRELKRRLVTELDQVRAVASRVESRFGAAEDLASGWDWTAAAAAQAEKHLVEMMKRCKQALTRLVKQKGSIWFNAPVDVVGMGLHDYNQIVKFPMDLGTVKAKLGRGLYSSPLQFASDIRLTFNNALLYNPEGHQVHKQAGQLLALFERSFSPAFDKYEKQLREAAMAGRQNGSLLASRPPLPPIIPAAPPSPARYTETPLQHQQQQLMAQSNAGMAPATGKQQPKPKALDPSKRAMTFEEKEKLSAALQNISPDKADMVINIVRRRNGEQQNGDDEFEIDFEAIDNETLWELDRFVGNRKKEMSKIRRQEATTSHQNSAAAAHQNSDAGDKSPALRRPNGDEDVDIGDELPSTHYPPMEIDKDIAAAGGSAGAGGGSASSSSRSSSSSDSSTDSDSGSSSSSASGDSAAAPQP